MVPSFLNKSELERLVAKEREAGDLWFQEFDVILNGKVSISVSTKTEDLTATNQNQVIFSILTSFFQVQSEKTLFVDERFPIHSIKNLKLFFSCLPLTSR